MVEPDGTLQNYYYREIATGRFEAGRHFITQDFIDEHTQDGWELIVVPEGQDLPDPMTHTIAPDTGEVTLKPVVNVVNKIPKLQELDTEVSNKITNGFYSIALSEGKVPPEAYFYPSDPVSQLNQLLGGLIMCKSPDGVWARRPHTEEQRAAVVSAFVTMRDTALTRLDTAREEVTAAATVDEVSTIALT
jgi:hypothetical protein